MGNAIGNASTDIGSFIGNVLTAPFKATLGRSCLNVCSGPWDLSCFIEHFCLPDIAKLVMISALCFIILMFITLLFKLGICQCVVKSICKMSCAACAMYWCAIGEMIRCLWYNLRNTKRVYRRKRLRDIEAASYYYPSDDEPSSTNSLSPTHNIRPKQRRRRRRQGSKHNHNRGSNRRLTRLRSRQLSVRVGGKSRRVRSARKMKSSKVRVKKLLKVKDVVD
ncbi:uncharacterized protein LOC112082930 [Eutrema salsugineum]|uniref:uncharacterized protein LOC112082930 n=1 Tax=Eutrema salsugineum TaxID=72664 RepID=UPI000CECF562|nr:uncharacterized protein LOC112082930 [Eutrema salsugineum]